MSDDLVTPLRNASYLAFEDGTNDYTTAPKAAYVLEAQAARIAELEAALNDAKQHFLADEPLKAFVEICAALVGGEDGHK